MTAIISPVITDERGMKTAALLRDLDPRPRLVRIVLARDAAGKIIGDTCLVAADFVAIPDGYQAWSGTEAEWRASVGG